MKNIVPGLLTFDTKLNRITGFSISNNLNFFQPSSSRSKYHYKIRIDSHIIVPTDYDFSCGYYRKKNNCWFYERKILGRFSIKFMYDIKQRLFTFNRLYSLIPFQIGGIYPVGQLISDVVRADMFVNKVLVILGMAVTYNKKNYCVIAPSFNGKTTLVKNILEQGGKYIADNLVILDLEKNIAYPTAHTGRVYGRIVNQQVDTLLDRGNTITTPVEIDKVVFMTNKMRGVENKKIHPSDFILMNSLAFLYTLFGRSYVAENNLTRKLMENTQYFSKKLSKRQFAHSIKFNSYERIFRKK